MFNCKICLEKELRINDHKAEITRLIAEMGLLRQLVYPSQVKVVSTDNSDLTQYINGLDEALIIDMEANNILTGNDGSQESVI